MALILAVLIFVTIAAAIFAFGAAAYAPSSILGQRLRSCERLDRFCRCVSPRRHQRSSSG